MKQQPESEVSFKELVFNVLKWVKYLFRNWLWIVLLGLLGGGIGVLDAYYQKWQYTATLSFAVEDDKGGGLSGAMGLASQFGIDLGGGGGSGSIFGGANLLELMKSRSLVEKTLLKPITVDGKEISLAELFINFNNWNKEWPKKPELRNIRFLPNDNREKFTRQHDSILGVIYQTLVFQNLKVAQKDKKASIITIDVITKNELFSKAFAEMLAKEVSDFYVDTKSKKSRINVAILEKQSDSIRNELNAAITGVATANDNTFNLNPGLNVKRAPSQRRAVDVQANTAILTELVKNLEIAKVTMRKETPLIQVIDRPILPLNKAKNGKFKQLVIGGILGGLIAIAFLTGLRWWKKMMADDTPKGSVSVG